MKYAIDKQFGIWRYARQPVMGKWFFNLAEKMLNTEKYFRAIKTLCIIMIIFKIAAVAIIVAITNQLLQKAGKEEYTIIITIVGLIVALMMFLPVINQLKDELSSIMDF